MELGYEEGEIKKGKEREKREKNMMDSGKESETRRLKIIEKKKEREREKKEKKREGKRRAREKVLISRKLHKLNNFGSLKIFKEKTHSPPRNLPPPPLPQGAGIGGTGGG